MWRHPFACTSTSVSGLSGMPGMRPAATMRANALSIAWRPGGLGITGKASWTGGGADARKVRQAGCPGRTMGAARDAVRGAGGEFNRRHGLMSRLTPIALVAHLAVAGFAVDD